MGTIQGEFATADAARRAVQGLKAAGIPAQHIRVWNIIPEGVPSRPGSYATRTGALAGGLLGGIRGYFAGAAVGGVLDSAAADGPHLPDPTGVRVVVDTSPTEPDPAAILRRLGAANVH